MKRKKTLKKRSAHCIKYFCPTPWEVERYGFTQFIKLNLIIRKSHMVGKESLELV